MNKCLKINKTVENVIIQWIFETNTITLVETFFQKQNILYLGALD